MSSPTPSAMLALSLALAVGTPLTAQQDGRVPAGRDVPVEGPAELEAQLQRLRDEGRRLELTMERLVDLRIRLDLGLPVDLGAFVVLTDDDRALPDEVKTGELRDLEGRVAASSATVARLTDALRNAQRPASPVAQPAAAPGTRLSGTLLDPDAAAALPRPRQAHDTTRQGSRPDGREAAGARAQSRPAPQPREELPKLVVKSSTDRSTVGRALHRAGRHAEAKRELADAARSKTPDLMDLFVLAQCHERLGELAEADDLYKRIQAFDTRETKDGKVVGTWGQAARLASQQMNWRNDQKDWKPPRPFESAPWKEHP